MTKSLNKRVSKDWTCPVCAKKKNWKLPKHGSAITAHTGLCGWCKRKDESTLIPCCDFNGPNGKRAVDD